MRTIVSRLIHSRSSLPRPFMLIAPRTGRYLSTDSNKVDEPFKVEEAETIQVPPPPTEKLLVLGGNGFVGSHVCREALDHGLSVASLSRSGRSKLHDSWANNVTWYQGNLLSPDSWKDALNDVTSVGAMERRPKSRNRENKQTAGALLKNGMLGFRSVKELSQQLPDWLDLSLKHSIPSSLLILSRAFYVSGRSEEVVDTIKVTSLPSEEINKVKGAGRIDCNNITMEACPLCHI